MTKTILIPVDSTRAEQHELVSSIRNGVLKHVAIDRQSQEVFVCVEVQNEAE